MILDYSKLNKTELLEFKRLLSKYKKYDKIDLIIHKTLKSLGINYEEFLSRDSKV